MMKSLLLTTILAIISIKCTLADYQIGVGRADCTGPAAGVTFMGYANLNQVGCGLHLRQFSRAFIFDDGINRALFITVDAGMMGHGVKMEVLRRLEEIYGELYTNDNTIISGTHTHNAPGGFLQDLLLDITVLGFHNETFSALVNGITNSVINAHESIVDGKVYVTSGELLDANINRSPASYLLNPEEERARYEHNVDKEMHQVKFVRSSDNELIGVLNWFAVHATSMNNTNCLVSSDNVGYASMLLESDYNEGYLPGKGSFVGAFASTNLGDVSPNIKGPICIDTGDECDFVHSSCSDGTSKMCIAFGPGETMAESTRIIATRLYNKAKDLLQGDSQEVTGPVKYIHQYVDMPNETITIEYENGTVEEVHGCRPGLGYGFAGGTTDGPGAFSFTQGTTTSDPFWDSLRNLLSEPTQEDIDCQHPKPILLNTGGISFPYQWQSRIVSTQIFLVGNLAIIAVPGEFTTMSGRRLRNAVQETIANYGGPNDTVPVIAGLSNVYTNYITTYEEYQLQRYEGGSTIFGPHTLDIYLNKYRQLAAALVGDETLEPGPVPEDFSDKVISILPPPIPDNPGEDQEFGQCLTQPNENVSIGDTVTAVFVAGHPRNNVSHESTFLEIQKLNDDGNWTVVANDASWETRYKYERISVNAATSQVTIEWDVEEEKVEPGVYRIKHQGHWKNSQQEISAYEGFSNNFQVTS